LPTEKEQRLSQLAVAQGLATEEEVHECLAEADAAEGEGRDTRFGDLLVRKGYLTAGQLERLTALARSLALSEARVGPYELLAKLGEGGMGAVYRARDTRTDTVIALKILPRSRARDEAFLARFEQEARAAFELSHPNIVRALDIGEADGYHYLAMEYVEGTDVFSVLGERGRLPEKEALSIVIQVAQALEHAWGEKLVHRDIKPDNILIDVEGTVRLADLGLAVDQSLAAKPRITDAGSAMGTPFYFSPEQARGEAEIDTRSDIYALGATLYEMVTGHPPFEGKSAAEIMLKHIQEDIPDPRAHAPELSEGLVLMLERMMAKDRADRYQNPAQLLEDLLLIYQDRPPKSARVRPPKRSAAASRGKRTALRSVPVATRRRRPVAYVSPAPIRPGQIRRRRQRRWLRRWGPWLVVLVLAVLSAVLLVALVQGQRGG